MFSEKTAKYEVWFDGRISMIEVEATPKGLSEKLYAVLTTDGTILEGRLGDKTITSTVVGGMDGKSSAVFEVVERIGSIEGAQPLDQVSYDGSAYNIVPYTGHGESVSVSGGKWRVIAKAGKVKFKKNRETKQNELVVDTGKTGTQTNISSLKLSYTKKTGLFKGSFIVHCIVDGKIKKYKFTVTGLVADGVGHGQAVYKKRSLTIAVPVTVK